MIGRLWLRDAECELAALEYANMVRRDIGLEPVDHLERGLPDQAGWCPIARTIVAGVPQPLSDWSVSPNVGSTYTIVHTCDPTDGMAGLLTLESHHYDPPKAVRRFIRRFDRGRLRHLRLNTDGHT